MTYKRQQKKVSLNKRQHGKGYVQAVQRPNRFPQNLMDRFYISRGIPQFLQDSRFGTYT
jgi:hypothetical protein